MAGDVTRAVDATGTVATDTQPPAAPDAGAAGDTGDTVRLPTSADEAEAEAVDDAEGDDETDDEATGRKGNLLTRQVQITPLTILLIVAVLAIGVGAYVLGQKQARDADPPAATGTSVPPTTNFVLPKDFAPFDDPETGIKLAVPKDWVVYSTKDLDRSYRLLVGVPNAKDNLRVRMNAYSTAVTKENITDQQAVVDSIFADEKIQILARETPVVNGMPALYYVYKFNDAQNEPGFHAHFFVFQGKKMVSLVFEAVPEARFALLAPVFDQIANSLQVTPGEPPAFLVEATNSGATGPATTAAPGATTAPPASTP